MRDPPDAFEAESDRGQGGASMIAFKASAIAITGVLQTLLDVPLSGVGPVRLSVFNRGFTALSAGKVQHIAGAGSAQPVDLDATTFASLAAQEIKQIVVPPPVERRRFQAT